LNLNPTFAGLPHHKVYCDMFEVMYEVDPIVWTKNERSFATLLPVFQTGNFELLLPSSRDFGYLLSRRVKRRLALLASIQPRDNPVEGMPMAWDPCVSKRGGLFLSSAS
jgi:hypothetical protein